MTKAQEPASNKNRIRILRWEKPTPLTQEEAEAHLHREGYESFCWYDVPGATYPKHRHENDECLWILRGELKLTINGEAFLLKSGDRIYLPAHTPHTAQSHEGATYMVGQKPVS